MHFILIRLKRWVQPELDRTVALLRKANEQLDRTLAENTQLKNRNDALRVKVNKLEADNRDLHQQLSLLKQAKELQGETIARMERHQKELQEKYEHMFARVVQLETRLNLDPHA